MMGRTDESSSDYIIFITLSTLVDFYEILNENDEGVNESLFFLNIAEGSTREEAVN